MSLRSVRSLSPMALIAALVCLLPSPGLSAPPATPSVADAVSAASGTGTPPTFVTDAVQKARAFASQNTHAPLGELGKLAVSQMRAFGAAMGVPADELQNVQVADYGTYVVAVTDKWVYDADVSNNQCFRPVSALSYLVQGFDHPGSLTGGSDLASQITGKARGIVAALGLQANLKNAYCKKEQVLAAQCGTEAPPKLYDGRCLVLLGTDDGIFLHLIGDAKCNPIRVETNIASDATRSLSKLLYQQLKAGGSFPVMSCGVDDMTFGTFFSRREPSFEANAKSFEGLKGQDLLSDSGSITSSGGPKVSDLFRNWDQNGRVGAVAGNWDNSKGEWQHSNIKVLHRSVTDYPIGQIIHKDYFSMGQDFYRDIESCVGAVFCSHGGPIDDNFTVDAGGHGWFAPADARSPYGTGSLRYVFFETCDSIDYTGGYKSLFSEWLPGKYIDSVRIVCGNNGVTYNLDRDGWRFFNRYNKGDSIETAWLYSSVVECAQNAPVTVAYGSTPEEALTTLTEGRFNKERAEPTYSVASLWREIK